MPGTNEIPTSLQHRVMFSDLAGCLAGDQIDLDGPEAQHLARVKRARLEELVGVLDGMGRLGVGSITQISGSKQRPVVSIVIKSIATHPKVIPAVDICCPIPKGDRLDRMIDQLTQIGASSWTPLVSDRCERKSDTIRNDRLERIIHEACKQCIRPHALVVHEPVMLDDAMQFEGDVFLCDGSASEPLGAVESGSCRVLIGPEGGWSDAERARFSASMLRRLGPHVLRLETAAVAAASVVLAGSSTQIPQGESP